MKRITLYDIFLAEINLSSDISNFYEFHLVFKINHRTISKRYSLSDKKNISQLFPIMPHK